jgi:hypothetical protein
VAERQHDSGDGSNSAREWRNVRESPRARGRGADWSRGEAHLL